MKASYRLTYRPQLKGPRACFDVGAEWVQETKLRRLENLLQLVVRSAFLLGSLTASAPAAAEYRSRSTRHATEGKEKSAAKRRDKLSELVGELVKDGAPLNVYWLMKQIENRWPKDLGKPYGIRIVRRDMLIYYPMKLMVYKVGELLIPLFGSQRATKLKDLGVTTRAILSSYGVAVSGK
jgi:hypothetical protein